jgi:hypothetical protein
MVGELDDPADLLLLSVAYPGILFGGVQQILLSTEGRENGEWGAVAP